MPEIYRSEVMYYFANDINNPIGELWIYGEYNGGIGSIVVSFSEYDGKAIRYDKSDFIEEQEGKPEEMMKQLSERRLDNPKDIAITTGSISVGKCIDEVLSLIISRYGRCCMRAYKRRKEADASEEERINKEFERIMQGVELDLER